MLRVLILHPAYVAPQRSKSRIRCLIPTVRVRVRRLAGSLRRRLRARRSAARAPLSHALRAHRLEPRVDHVVMITAFTLGVSARDRAHHRARARLASCARQVLCVDRLGVRLLPSLRRSVAPSRGRCRPRPRPRVCARVRACVRACVRARARRATPKPRVGV